MSHHNLSNPTRSKRSNLNHKLINKKIMQEIYKTIYTYPIHTVALIFKNNNFVFLMNYLIYNRNSSSKKVK